MARQALFAVLLIVLSSSQVSLPAQKQVTEYRTFVDYFPPPATAQEMTSAAAAVVVAKHTGKVRLVERGASPEERLWDTYYTFEVVEIVKFHTLVAPPGETLELDLPGGEKEFSTHIERQRPAGIEPLRRNHEYLIFLHWIPIQNRLTFAWGPMGIYDVTDGRVRSAETGWRRHNGKSRAEFIAEVKARK